MALQLGHLLAPGTVGADQGTCWILWLSKIMANILMMCFLGLIATSEELRHSVMSVTATLSTTKKVPLLLMGACLCLGLTGLAILYTMVASSKVVMDCSLPIGCNTGMGKPEVFPKRVSQVRVRYWILIHCGIPCTCAAVLQVFTGLL